MLLKLNRLEPAAQYVWPILIFSQGMKLLIGLLFALSLPGQLREIVDAARINREIRDILRTHT